MVSTLVRAEARTPPRLSMESAAAILVSDTKLKSLDPDVRERAVKISGAVMTTCDARGSSSGGASSVG
jgi:hypothetical protein